MVPLPIVGRDPRGRPLVLHHHKDLVVAGLVGGEGNVIAVGRPGGPPRHAGAKFRPRAAAAACPITHPDLRQPPLVGAVGLLGIGVAAAGRGGVAQLGLVVKDAPVQDGRIAAVRVHRHEGHGLRVGPGSLEEDLAHERTRQDRRAGRQRCGGDGVQRKGERRRRWRDGRGRRGRPPGGRGRGRDGRRRGRDQRRHPGGEGDGGGIRLLVDGSCRIPRRGRGRNDARRRRDGGHDHVARQRRERAHRCHQRRQFRFARGGRKDVGRQRRGRDDDRRRRRRGRCRRPRRHDERRAGGEGDGGGQLRLVGSRGRILRRRRRRRYARGWRGGGNQHVRGHGGGRAGGLRLALALGLGRGRRQHVRRRGGGGDDPGGGRRRDGSSCGDGGGGRPVLGGGGCLHWRPAQEQGGGGHDQDGCCSCSNCFHR